MESEGIVQGIDGKGAPVRRGMGQNPGMAHAAPVTELRVAGATGNPCVFNVFGGSTWQHSRYGDRFQLSLQQAKRKPSSNACMMIDEGRR